MAADDREIRLAFVGKGGAGKSCIAGTVCRLLAQRGRRILAVDSDPMPGLAWALGIDSRDDAIPQEAMVEVDDDPRGRRWRLRPGLDVETAISRYGTRGPDGVHLLHPGKASVGVMAPRYSHAAVHQITRELPESWDIVGDLPGGTRQPFLGWGEYATDILVVVEATPASLLSGRRLARLSTTEAAPRVHAVANRVRSDNDAPRIAEHTGLDVLASIPYDEDLAHAEREGFAPLDAVPDGPAVASLRILARQLDEGALS